ncbi:NF-kappa-B essential modulator isoform X2 [Phlebotomus papatasi]|uniref:NF-kappa-B essential modulator isoform X2 n=1 Tax=Phlebotomus papatasi TaxID=29031 RepID=UPI002483C799|nr:NF-kappa-B essential modulator isoform X2 [Phlebotomus papatasi]
MEVSRDKESPVMCDEESFVILGSTPTPSMECLAQSYATDLGSEEFSSLPEVSAAPGSKNASLVEEEGAVGGVSKEESIATSSDATDSVKVAIEPPKVPETEVLSPPSFQLNSTVTQASLVNWPETSQAPQSLSTSHFNIYSEFPSMKGQNIASQDLSKLENFYCEHNQLKENLLNSNRCLRQYFALAEKWQNEIRDFKRQQDVYQTHVVGENERLRGVVEQLEGRLREKNGELEGIRAENRQAIEALSEQHDRELQELREELKGLREVRDSGEKSTADAEIKWRQEMAHLEFSMGEKLRVAEMKESQWHQEVAGLTEKFSGEMHEMRQRLAQETARVAQLEEQCRNFHAENDALKVNLVSAEEVNRMLRADSADALQKVEQIEAFKMQAELFERDFEAERAARTVLAGEKEQLLADLRLLQNRHEQLIGEMESMRNPRSGYPHPESQRSRQFRCPVCSRLFLDLSTLNSHVNDCLDSDNH